MYRFLFAYASSLSYIPHDMLFSLLYPSVFIHNSSGIFAEVVDTIGESIPVGRWAVLILQAGSFGLLTYMVVKLGPEVMKAATAERMQRDQIFATIVEKMESKFDARTEATIRALQIQTEAMKIMVQKQTDEMREALRRVGNPVRDPQDASKFNEET